MTLTPARIYNLGEHEQAVADLQQHLKDHPQLPAEGHAKVTETTLRRTVIRRKDDTIKGIKFEVLEPGTGRVLADRTSGTFDFHGCLIERGTTVNTGLQGQGEAGRPFTRVVGYFGREDLLLAGIRKALASQHHDSSHHPSLKGLPRFSELLVARVPKQEPVKTPADWFRIALAKARAQAQQEPGNYQLLLDLADNDHPLGRVYQWHEAHECFYPDHGGQPDLSQSTRMVAHAAASIEHKHRTRLLVLYLPLEAGSRGSGTSVTFDSNNYAACR